MSIEGYDDAVAARYDADWAGLDVRRGDVEFYVELASDVSGAVLEVAAGTGRVLLPVARAVAPGVAVHAVEPSPAMRRRLAERLASEARGVRERVTVHDGHFGAIPLPGASMALSFAAFRSFQHLLDVPSQLAALAELKRVTAPGGCVVLELFEPRYAMLDDCEPLEVGAYETDAGHVVRRFDARVHDRARQVVRVDFEWIEETPDGEVVAAERGSYRVRYTFRYELEHLLHRAGWRDFELLGGFDRAPLSDEPRELIVIARF